MINDNIELLNLIEISQYDIDKQKSTVHVDKVNKSITADVYITPRYRDCPFCKSNGAIIHSHKTRRLYHPILSSYTTTIIFHQILFKCKECGHSFVQYNPLCSGSKSITKLGELNLLEQLRSPRKTFKDLSNEYFIPESSIIRCFDEHINIKRHELSKVICFDEIYAKKLTDTKYAFCIFDPMANIMLDIVDCRRKNTLEPYFSRIPIKERLKVQYVNIDMYNTYKVLAEQAFPNATICCDSFHVIEHLTKAMDQYRLAIQRKFIKDKDSDKNGYYWLLKSFHYYFTSNFDDINYHWKPKSHYSYLRDKYAVLNKLLSIDKGLKEAYELQMDYREFNKCGTYEEALYKIDDFIERFYKIDFLDFKNFATTLSNWKFEIINSFLVIDGKRMSNGPIESVNGRTKRILYDGYGYSNFERFRNRVMFSLNKKEPLIFK